MIAMFEKTGRLIWFSHLDLQRAMQRALRRSGLPIQYSQGFNPHVNLSFASALAVGVASTCELLDVPLTQNVEPETFMRRMNECLPTGLKIHFAKAVEDQAPSPMAQMRFAVYRALVDDADAVQKAEAFMQQSSVLVKKESKGKTREVDIRPLVHALTAQRLGESCVLTMTLTCTNADNLKPELLLAVLCPDAYARITRTALLAKAGDAPLNLYEAAGQA